MILRLLIALLLISMLGACQKVRETPSVFLPEITKNAETGDTLMIRATFTDESQLKSGGLRIRVEGKEIPGTLPAWHLAKIFPLDGKTDFYLDSIPIPDSVSRNDYRVNVFAEDADGLTDTLKYTLGLTSLLDKAAPLIDSLIVPDTISTGSDLRFYMEIRDDRKLAYAEMTFTSVVNDSIILQIDSILSASLATFDLLIPEVGPFQQIKMEGKFYDWVNNVSSETVNIIVKE